MEQPKIPTLKDSQKPQVKIKGIQAGLTLLDRLKQFKKKDLAFILAGLGTLFMAPLAEHFMMSPESGDATLQQGWGGGKGAGNNLFGSGASPYEPGTSGTAPGSAIGGGADVITPLNVRDPSALVMGPGASQQPPTNSAAPVTPPPSARSEPDLKDALAGAAARAASAAVKKAPLPVPKMALGGSGLRGLGVAGGGSSAAGGLGAISSNGLASGKADTGGGLGNVRTAPNYRGVGTRGPNNANGGALEALKAAAGKAGEAMNRGAATSGLAEAAAQQMTGGAGFSGAGSGGMGGADKGFGGNGGKDSKSVGESLDFINKKSRMEKELELEFEKRKKQEMFWPDLMRDAQKELFMKGLIGPAAECMGGVLKAGGISKSKCFSASKDPGTWICQGPPGVGGKVPTTSLSGDSVCQGKGSDIADKCVSSPDGKNGTLSVPGGGTAWTCELQGGDGSVTGTGQAGSTEEGVATGPGAIAGPTGSEAQGIAAVARACAKLVEAEKNTKDIKADGNPGLTSDKANRLKGIEKLLAVGANLAAARDALYAGASDDCDNKAKGIAVLSDGGVFGAADKAARAQLDISFTKLGTAVETAAVGSVKKTADAVKASDAKSATADIKKQATEAEAARTAALKLIGANDKEGSWKRLGDAVTAGVGSLASNEFIIELRKSPAAVDKADADLYSSLEGAKTALDAIRVRQFNLAKDDGPVKTVVEGVFHASTAEGGGAGEAAHKDTLNIAVKLTEDNATVITDAKKLEITPANATLKEETVKVVANPPAAGEDAKRVITAIGTDANADTGRGAVKLAQTVLPEYAKVKDAPTTIKSAITGTDLTAADATAKASVQDFTVAKTDADAANKAVVDYKAKLAEQKAKPTDAVIAADVLRMKPLAQDQVNTALQSVADLKAQTQILVDKASQRVADVQVIQKGVAANLGATIEGAKKQQQAQ